MKNFGKLKNIFNSILAEGISEKNETKKDVFKKYIKLLKENKILKTQFDIYTGIESMVEENELKASEKIKIILEPIKQYNKKDIKEANDKLAKLIIFEQVDFAYNEENLHENISNLIFSKDVDTYVNSLYETVKFVNKNVITENKTNYGVDNNLFAVVAVNKFNEAYSDLNEEHKSVIKKIVEGDTEVKMQLFKESVNDCIVLINEKLKDADLSLKESLLAAKESLLNKSYDNDFEKNLLKILKLKEDLVK